MDLRQIKRAFLPVNTTRRVAQLCAAATGRALLANGGSLGYDSPIQTTSFLTKTRLRIDTGE